MLYLGPGHASIFIAFVCVHLPELCPWQLFTQSSKLLLLLHWDQSLEGDWSTQHLLTMQQAETTHSTPIIALHFTTVAIFPVLDINVYDEAMWKCMSFVYDGESHCCIHDRFTFMDCFHLSIELQPFVLLSTCCVRSGCMYLYPMCISFYSSPVVCV